MSGAGVSVPAPPPSEAPTSPTLLKTFSSKLLRSMRRSSEAKEPLSTQMSNLSPHRQHGESAGTPVVILVTPLFITIITFVMMLVMMMMILTTTSDMILYKDGLSKQAPGTCNASERPACVPVPKTEQFFPHMIDASPRRSVPWGLLKIVHCCQT